MFIATLALVGVPVLAAAVLAKETFFDHPLSCCIGVAGIILYIHRIQEPIKKLARYLLLS